MVSVNIVVSSMLIGSVVGAGLFLGTSAADVKNQKLHEILRACPNRENSSVHFHFGKNVAIVRTLLACCCHLADDHRFYWVGEDNDGESVG